MPVIVSGRFESYFSWWNVRTAILSN